MSELHRRDRAVDGLRGLCALSVLLFHALGQISTAHNYDWAWHVPLALVGVDVFFMISGYLMLDSARRHKTAGSFVLARIRRVYPTFITLQIIVFVVGYINNDKGLGDPVYLIERFIFDGLMLPGIVRVPPIQTVAWTLSYEAAFYLMVAVMRHRSDWLIAGVCLALSTVRPYFICFAIGIVLRTLRFEPPRLLAWAPVVWLGTISYSFYLWHPTVLHAAARTVGHPVIYLAIALIGTGIVAHLSWSFIEIPGQRLRLQRLRLGPKTGNRSQGQGDQRGSSLDDPSRAPETLSPGAATGPNR
jgi:peptidoglycan/LPS O-acetylase OafA/YrhL